MSKVLIENSTLVNIAEAIRNQSENSSQMLPSEMPTHILNIDTEKTTVNGEKVKEKLDLFTYQNTMEFVINNPVSEKILSKNYFSYSNEDIIDTSGLQRRSKCIYIPSSTSSTQIVFEKPLSIVNIKGEVINIDLPPITIPSTSEYPTNSNAINEIKSFIIQNHLQDFYLICFRTYIKNKNSYEQKYGNGYVTIFKLNFDNNYNLSLIQKCHEIRCFETDSIYDNPSLSIYGVSVYIDDNEAILFGSSGKTDLYSGDTCLYLFNFNNNSYTNIDTTSIFGTKFHGGFSRGFIAKIQNTIYIYQTDDDVSKCIEIDTNTNTIINSKNASEFYINNLNLILNDFIYNNKLYFNGIQNSTYYLYEFIPTTWEIKKIIEINNITDSGFLLNGMPLYLCTLEFYYHFDLDNFSFSQQYYLPEIPEIPKEWEQKWLKGVVPISKEKIQHTTRYFFLPQYNCLLAYSKIHSYASIASVSMDVNLYKVYMRLLDNKPLVYTALQL